MDAVTSNPSYGDLKLKIGNPTPMHLESQNETTRPPGEAPIKKEYLVEDFVKTLALDYVPADVKEELLGDGQNGDGEGPDAKKPRIGKEKKKLLTGQNKDRPKPQHFDRSSKICPAVKAVAESEEWPECKFNGCSFIHDVPKFLESKEPDIGDECFVFRQRGFCPSGVACRFGKDHILPDGKNKRVAELVEKYSAEKNYISKEVTHLLRKKKYDLKKSEEVLDSYLKNKAEFGFFSRDEDAPKKVDWKSKPLYLAPLTTVGNLPFRRICKEFGADITCGEMALGTSLLTGRVDEWVLTKRHPSEDFFGVQICGSNANVLSKCAQLLSEQCEVDFIDVNMGCPIDALYFQGAGSGLMRRKSMAEQIARTMKRVVGPNFPITLKMRTGVSTDKTAHELITAAKDWGVDMITLHGRSRTQRYKNNADWNYIEECAKAATPIPVFGNGDVLSFEDEPVRRLYDSKDSSVSGLMIGRGALIKPWIFKEIKEQRHFDISSGERLDIVKKYSNYGLEHWGSDPQGVDRTRRFLLEWLSFTHRYIPVGLLEVLPQKINERPPPYRGRNDLETLMSSPNCSDWVMITEMVLGPVPEDFKFLPKHKANAWG